MKYFTKENPMGGYNGYVVVPPSHPTVKSGKINPDNDKWCDKLEISVHGGITFNERYDNRNEWKGWPISKVEKGSIILGFDTCHAYDTPEKWPRWKVQEEARKLIKEVENLTLSSTQGEQ